MLHVKLPDVRIPEIFFIALQILFTHFAGVDEMDLRILHMDVFLKPGEQVRVILIFDGLRAEFCKAAHEPVCRLITHFEKAL